MALEITSDVENRVLGRREVKCVFRSMAGLVKRDDAKKAVVQKLKIESSKLFLVSLKGKHGTADLEGLFYIYDDSNEAKRQLPPYIFLRIPVEEKGVPEKAEKRPKRKVKTKEE